MVHAYLGGIAARSQTYMRAHWDHAKGLLDDAALQDLRTREEADHATAQQDAGLDLTAPALVAWEDLLRPLATGLGGVEAEALSRYFETNTFYRRLHVTGEVLPPADPAVFLKGSPIPAGPWVLSLPSPHDAARRSRDEQYGDIEALSLAYGEALHPVVQAAVRSGAALVRFHDPSALYPGTPLDLDALVVGLRAAARGAEETCTLHLTNGDPYDRPEVLAENPLGGLSIEDPGRAPPDDLSLPPGTRLSVAVIHGEQSLVEDPRRARDRAAAVAEALGLPLWGITNGWDLDHVPHAIARQKIAVLGHMRTLLAEVVA